eukprot:Gregarina_sp_Poly_1__8899@NODE_537_length_7626_cov_271_043524_g424_i0_p1_GENE_NODE_537_length_7626_cov_271_043524_g424_i0NODE_537_length_7626_cov_271_043524_g424_i0_p1_ORF_typecomplete_len1007_score193_27Ank_4/PF13637_6/0_005Ank_4/PF13637_6/7_8e06Ank_4/PF13637_6/3_2e05Ank_4/PF13637_6/1_7e02Ank_4/PF13637_6/1_5e03Ank_2/PF12796_7/5_7e11Ank_2/PF12796_7/0_00011Ank_2/PF12796_7/4_2e05Ank_2/PF12796_7/6_2e03Ank_5/PF13857_6/0_2Ank_5/PF13857_6/2_1e06Ank_5/PF13857_6/3_6e05Ank_5/PF13857_6/6_7e02Ank_5/PF13857
MASMTVDSAAVSLESPEVVIPMGGGSPTTTAGSVSPRKPVARSGGRKEERSARRNKENQPVGSSAEPVAETGHRRKKGSSIKSASKQDETETTALTATPETTQVETGDVLPITETRPQEAAAPEAVVQVPSVRAKSSKSKSPSKALSPEAMQTKAKIAALISKSFAGSAYEVFAGTTTDCLESCFPSVSISDGLKPGSDVIPGSESLPAVLKQVDLSEFDDSKSENSNVENLRDITMAGAFIGSSEVIEECLKKGADLSMTDASGRNIFHILATTGHASLLRKVLRRLEKTHGNSAVTPNSVVKGDGSQRSVSKKNKRPPPDVSFSEIINAADKRGWTPLLVAVCRNNVEAAEALLAHPQLNFECWLQHTCPPSQHNDDCKSSAIHFAAIQGNAGLVKRLMVCGVPINITDTMGRNVFHYAAALKDNNLSLNFLKGLQEEPQFDKSLLLLTDSHGRSPIFIAIAWGNLLFLEACLQLVLAEFMQSSESAETAPKAVSSQVATVSTELDDPPHPMNSDAPPSSSNSPLSLSHLTLSRDVFSMTPVQIAFLRRHYHVIFRLSQIWSHFRHPELDPVSFVEALTAGVVGGKEAATWPGSPPPSPSRILSSLLADQSLFKRPLEADLSALEASTFKALQAALASEKFPALHGTQLLRAVRAAGPELCLRCLTHTLESEKEGGLIINNRRLTLEGTFFHFLKIQMDKEMSQASAAFNWRFIHVERHYARQGTKEERRRSHSVTSLLSQSESYSVPVIATTSPQQLRPPMQSSFAASRRQGLGPAARNAQTARSSSLTEPRNVRVSGVMPPSPRGVGSRASAQLARVSPAPRRIPPAAGRDSASPAPHKPRGPASQDGSLQRPSPPVGRHPLSKSAMAPQRPSAALPASGPRFAAPTYSALANSRVFAPASQSQSPALSRSFAGPPASRAHPPHRRQSPTLSSGTDYSRPQPAPPQTAPTGGHTATHQRPPVSSAEGDDSELEEETGAVLGHERLSSLPEDEDISFEDQDDF